MCSPGLKLHLSFWKTLKRKHRRDSSNKNPSTGPQVKRLTSDFISLVCKTGITARFHGFLVKLSEGPSLGAPRKGRVFWFYLLADLDGLQGLAASWVLRLHLGWISQKL